MKLQIGIDGKSYEVEVEITEEDNAPRPAYLPPQAPATAVPSRAGAAPVQPKVAAPEAVADESKVCRSPIAGVVIRVNAQVGQQIQPNDLLLVLEAMKMETNVTAPVAGKVKNITVQPGDAVQLNQVLVELE
jgi:methylmalonyl-CoA carboxyltransferase small subunit